MLLLEKTNKIFENTNEILNKVRKMNEGSNRNDRHVQNVHSHVYVCRPYIFESDRVKNDVDALPFWHIHIPVTCHI